MALTKARLLKRDFPVHGYPLTRNDYSLRIVFHNLEAIFCTL